MLGIIIGIIIGALIVGGYVVVKLPAIPFLPWMLSQL